MLQVQADHPVGMAMAEEGSDEGTDVCPLRGKAPIAEPVHQYRPQVGNIGMEHARLGERTGKAETGQGRDDHVESICRIAAVRRRIGERADNLAEIPECPRPAVSHDQGHGAGALAPDMHEMDRYAIDHGPELRPGIHRRFVVAPVIAIEPMGRQFTHPGKVCPCQPGAVVADFLRPARIFQPLAKVVQCLVGNSDTERDDFIFHRVPSPHLSVPVRWNDNPFVTRRRARALAGPCRAAVHRP